MIIHPYSTASKSARALAEALGCKILKRTGKVLTHRRLLNWGCSTASERCGFGTQFINHPVLVADAANKLTSLIKFNREGVSHVPWTTDKAVAETWQEEKHIVFARQSLTGHSGHGIVIIRAGDPIPDAPLYTLYVKKKKEYRVHVMFGKVIDYVQKRRQNGAKSNLIRSHKNGYVFCREGVTLSDDVGGLAIKAVGSLGLDFGAVDIITGLDGQHYCLEVNTAPGLEGQTVLNYRDALLQYKQ